MSIDVVRGTTGFAQNQKEQKPTILAQVKSAERIRSAPPKLKSDKWSKGRERLLSCVISSVWSDAIFLKDQRNNSRCTSTSFKLTTSRLGTQDAPINDDELNEDIKYSESSQCSSIDSQTIISSPAESIHSQFSDQSPKIVSDKWRKVAMLMKASARIAALTPCSSRRSSESPIGSGPIVNNSSSNTTRSSRQRRRYSTRKHFDSKFQRMTSQMSLSRLEEIYNVRAGFKPIELFQKSTRLLLILIKAGGCFGNQRKLTVGQDKEVTEENEELEIIEGAGSFNPKLYEADQNLKLTKDIVKMLHLHPEERTPDMIEKIMRAIQLVLETFADYPLDTQRALSKYAYFEVIESGRIVMKKGDRPLRFHIIMTGRALLADIYELPNGKEEIRWRGVLSKGENFGDEDSCFLHNGGSIHSGENFLPRKQTIVSNEMDVLVLDAEDYLAIFHPGSVKLLRTLKSLNTPLDHKRTVLTDELIDSNPNSS